MILNERLNLNLNTKKILGMQIIREKDNDLLFLNQHGYANKILKKFGMFERKLISLPLANHFKLSTGCFPKIEEKFNKMSKFLMQILLDL